MTPVNLSSDFKHRMSTVPSEPSSLTATFVMGYMGSDRYGNVKTYISQNTKVASYSMFSTTTIRFQVSEDEHSAEIGCCSVK